ncbi:hypothetical protein PY092_04280 [Muricauda sp. 334s03]|uniref:DUF998 domain-containing protein n=2 Tax=Flagellimonas TaxID=444459 RepID=A0ABT5XPD4_9FLAO|nr:MULTISPECIES: hypothetical protein [Allomuricauda]MDF0707456.1 hypothetical protein [[Muricauda] okinawensis]MDF0715357.1 hypothetical protein [[Muricauda] yonaguniensis]
MAKTGPLSEKPMKWYHYIAGFFAGVFFTNATPHYINGISGHPFPTPFADPPTIGLSSPMTNVIWALFNFLAGYLLFRTSKINPKRKLGLLVFFAGIVFFAITFSFMMMDRV